MAEKYVGHNINSRFRLQIRQVWTLTERINYDLRYKESQVIFKAFLYKWSWRETLKFLIRNLSKQV